MKCSRCPDDFSMAALTFHEGVYWCPRDLYNLAMAQIASKVVNDPHPYTRTPSPVVSIAQGRKGRRTQKLTSKGGIG